MRIPEHVGVGTHRLPPLDLEEFGSFDDYLDGRLTDFFKRLGRKVKSGVKRVGRKVRKFTSRVVRKHKKVFTRYGGYIAMAAQALNFVVPGLGAAVGAAVGTAHKAMVTRQQKKEIEEMEKADRAAMAQEEAALAKEEAALWEQANAEADKAYDKGEALFSSAPYFMTRDKWAKLTAEDKIRFLNTAVYDADADKLQKMGVTREMFLAMTPEEQAEILALSAGMADAEGPDIGTIVLIAGGTVALLAVTYLLLRKR